MPAPGRLVGECDQIAGHELRDLLLDLGGMSVVLDEEAVSGYGYHLPCALPELECQLRPQDERLAALVLAHPLLPRLAAVGGMGLGAGQGTRRVIQHRAGRGTLHADHAVGFTRVWVRASSGRFVHGQTGDPVRIAPPRTLTPSMIGTAADYPGLRMGQSGVRSSEAWLEALRAEGSRREEAISDLYALLLRAARFELRRRRAALSHVRGEELEDIARQAADDALMAVLAKLDEFRGASRFTTWAYKFALLEAGVKLRRRAWQGREVLLEPDAWPAFADRRGSPQDALEGDEMMRALRSAIDGVLTPHQRAVFVALALGAVPIDVLAERLGTTRGALYKTLHDARRKLRHELSAAGYVEENR